MSEKHLCPTCGAELSPGAVQGLCPNCLLDAALESHTHGANTAGRPQSSDPASAATVPPPDSASDEPRPPGLESLASQFPQLEMLEILGRGGMGVVYKARQRKLNRVVAVKILPPRVGDERSFAERFAREAQSLARLNHPNIVQIYDFGQTDEYFYFVMEFVDGVNLRALIREGKLRPEEALRIVPQICEALQFAHDEGIVHRDVKPENILIDTKGRVKIADFGLAKLLGATPQDWSLTGTGQLMGTLGYMAPEQLQQAHLVDHRADIYSLGVVFYEMLTGQLPIGRFEPPSKKVDIDVRLDEVVLRSLESEPGRRYQHASDVKTDLEPFIEPASKNRPRPPVRAADALFIEGARRSRIRLVGDALFAVASIALACCVIQIVLLALDSWQRTKPFREATLGNSIYGIWMLTAAQLLRRLRGRMFVVFSVLGVGIALPSFMAFLCVDDAIHGMPGSLTNSPWLLFIPQWLGIPIAVWAAAALFRRDVEALFEAEALRKETPISRVASEDRPSPGRGTPPRGVETPSDLESSRQPQQPTGPPQDAAPALTIANEALNGGEPNSPRVERGASRMWRPGAIAAGLFGIYAFSFVLPAYSVESRTGLLRMPNSPQMWGYDCFLAGWSGGRPTIAWCANPVFWIGCLFLAVRHWGWAGLFGLFAVPLAVHVVVANDLPIYLASTALPGYWVWFGSMILLCVVGLTGWWRSSERASLRANDMRAAAPVAAPWLARRAIIALGLLGLVSGVLAYAYLNSSPEAPTKLSQTLTSTPTPTPRLPSKEESPTVEMDTRNWVMGPEGPRMNNGPVRFWLKPAQVIPVNQALQETFREYLALEKQNMDQTRDEQGHVITAIRPLTKQLASVEGRLWSRLDPILDREQQKTFRLNLELYPRPPVGGTMRALVRQGLLGWGENDVRIEIWREGTWYRWKVRNGHNEDSNRSPELPEELRRFWKDASQQTAKNPGDKTIAVPAGR